MDPVTLGILLASGGLFALAVSGPKESSKPESFDWEAFLRREEARQASEQQRVAFDRMQELGMAVPVRAIASKEDLFELFAVKSEEGLSRAIYEYTACGAWCRIFPPGRVRDFKSDRVETFQASLDIEEGTVRCTSLVDAMGVSCLENPPEDVAVFLHLQPGGGTDVQPEDLDRIREGDWVPVVRRREDGVDVEIRVKIFGWRKHSGGIQIGSTVEGTESSTDVQELFFPFTEEQFDAAILEVEEEASEIWDSVHLEEEGDPDW